VNIIVVLGSSTLNADLQQRFARERARNGGPISVVLLDNTSGVTERETGFMQLTHEAAIKEYFFGDPKRTLNPLTQSVGFDEISLFTAPDGKKTP
jgi:polyribonucleotide 5'-hydroxyl-kinase